MEKRDMALLIEVEHECFSSESDETMQAFFDIMQDRDRTPEERADILMNGTVQL